MRSRRSAPGAAVALGLVLLAATAGLAALAAPARGAGQYPPLSANIAGPTTIGTLQSRSYEISATGGPAEALNGTVVGTYTYSASFYAVNTTGLAFGPASTGVLVNGSINLTLSAGNITEPVTLTVTINSTLSGVNATTNVSLLVEIVEPFVLSTTLLVGSGASVSAFALTVTLDGSPVGSIAVPSLTPGQSYPLSFRYVATDLSPGWHAFSINVAGEHGLVGFPGGQQVYTQTFYVQPAPPDDTPWYIAGAAAFVLAIFIWVSLVGGRRRRRGRK